MRSILRARDLTADEMVAILHGFRFPGSEPTRAWLEAPDGWSLAYWRGVDGSVPWCRAASPPADEKVSQLLPRLTGGRVFAPAGELRWRVLQALGPASCRAVYLGADLDAVGLLGPRSELNDLTPHISEHPLWGLLTSATQGRDGEPDEWVELRIPHRFRYPVDPPDRSWKRVGVKAIIETWVDRCGEPHFTRLCDLQAYEGE